MKVWRELTLDFFFLGGVFFAFRGVLFRKGCVLLLLRGFISA